MCIPGNLPPSLPVTALAETMIIPTISIPEQVVVLLHSHKVLFNEELDFFNSAILNLARLNSSGDELINCLNDSSVLLINDDVSGVVTLAAYACGMIKDVVSVTPLHPAWHDLRDALDAKSSYIPIQQTPFPDIPDSLPVTFDPLIKRFPHLAIFEATLF